ncbi:MAG: winged helix-turn-helix domain-containing protein, partial [Bacteroidetes bacterium]|nr:winged helix-turn-helix domain-containing protein [Bacteroidota bacterium]
QLVQQATQGNFHTIGEAAKWVEQTYGVHYTYFGMRSLVERLRLKKKVPRPIGAKASMEAQEAWKRGASEQFA